MSLEERKGKLIVLEGIDGSGLSTQAARLHDWLTKRVENKVMLTKEPSEGPIGTLIRQALSGRLTGLSQETLALLFAADRIDHVQNKIVPALIAGYDVICDRYLLSSLSYQSLTLNSSWIEEINARAIQPDITVFIEVNPETSLTRIHTNRFQVDLFEKRSTLNQVMANYKEFIRQKKGKGETVLEINGELSINEVTNKILTGLENLLDL